MSTTEKKLSGKNALITGGSSGIGFATAKRFVDEGGYVFITGRREPELNAVVKEIGENATNNAPVVLRIGHASALAFA